MTNNTNTEKTKQYLIKFFQNPYINTILKGLGLILLALIILLFFLKIYTRHNQEQPTPNLVGMSIEEATKTIAMNNLRI